MSSNNMYKAYDDQHMIWNAAFYSFTRESVFVIENMVCITFAKLFVELFSDGRRDVIFKCVAV